MSERYNTSSEDETIALGERVASNLPQKCVVLLIGNLGAGKTTMAKGFAKHFGISPEEVTSPTFTLIHEYSERLYHVDLYRLDESRAVARLGLDELFDRNATVLIEWGERFPELMPEDHVEIRLTRTGEDGREIEVCVPDTAGGRCI